MSATMTMTKKKAASQPASPQKPILHRPSAKPPLAPFAHHHHPTPLSLSFKASSTSTSQPLLPLLSSISSSSSSSSPPSSSSLPSSGLSFSDGRKRTESLPDLSAISFSSPSLVIPQPRKALVSPKILLPSTPNPFEISSQPEQEVEVHHEALSELLEILRSSSQSGYMGSDTPGALSLYEEDLSSPSQEEEEEEDAGLGFDGLGGFEEEDAEMQEAMSRSYHPYSRHGSQYGMDIPSLSSSPISEVPLGVSPAPYHHPLGRPGSYRARSVEPLDAEKHSGTPPMRAPNPLAFSCHFASLEKGAELDLLRPSPPIYDLKEA